MAVRSKLGYEVADISKTFSVILDSFVPYTSERNYFFFYSTLSDVHFTRYLTTDVRVVKCFECNAYVQC